MPWTDAAPSLDTSSSMWAMIALSTTCAVMINILLVLAADARYTVKEVCLERFGCRDVQPSVGQDHKQITFCFYLLQNNAMLQWLRIILRTSYASRPCSSAREDDHRSGCPPNTQVCDLGNGTRYAVRLGSLFTHVLNHAE